MQANMSASTNISTNHTGEWDEWFELPKMNNFVDVFSIGCSITVIFGGLIPYIPQYLKIKRSMNSEGFSTYVCLTLLIANLLRIMFWFGHHFELPLLIQSFVMILGMLAMMEICIRVRDKRTSFSISAISGAGPGRRRRFQIGKLLRRIAKSKVTESDEDDETQRNEESPIYSVLHTVPGQWDGCEFWNWDDFLSYVKFLSLFTTMFGLLTYLLVDSYLYIEILGYVAVFTESMLGIPQLLKNHRKKSTQGMSVEMVVMWLSGDLFKTLYFIIRHAPPQFYVCGSTQVVVDILILYQVLWYRRPNVTYRKLPETN